MGMDTYHISDIVKVGPFVNGIKHLSMVILLLAAVLMVKPRTPRKALSSGYLTSRNNNSFFFSRKKNNEHQTPVYTQENPLQLTWQRFLLFFICHEKSICTTQKRIIQKKESERLIFFLEKRYIISLFCPSHSPFPPLPPPIIFGKLFFFTEKCYPKSPLCGNLLLMFHHHCSLGRRRHR